MNSSFSSQNQIHLSLMKSALSVLLVLGFASALQAGEGSSCSEVLEEAEQTGQFSPGYAFAVATAAALEVCEGEFKGKRLRQFRRFVSACDDRQEQIVREDGLEKGSLPTLLRALHTWCLVDATRLTLGLEQMDHY